MAIQDDILAAVQEEQDALASIAASQATLSDDISQVAAAIQAAVNAGALPDQATMDALAAVANNTALAAQDLSTSVDSLGAVLHPPTP